ncbi:unnamed protein product [Caenorhabditis bovis]|uniref:Serpentine receptor class gamma n=1 Tax=Caenorhabditis bovis TaxID=2654633 RepID=A0A8S1ECF0_9PELO|nr:unnamed protein product [Caenorhabditis bovis]
MDLLSNPKFMITLSYGSISMMLYAIVSIVIFNEHRQFNGSFFRMFVAGSFMNLWTYLNSFVTIRIPQHTNYNGTFAPIYLKLNQHNTTPCSFLSFCHMMHFQFAYTQYMYNFITCLNRVSAILFPMRSEQFWQKYIWAILSFVFIGPFIFTYHLYFNTSYFEYNGTFFVTLSTYVVLFGVIPNIHCDGNARPLELHLFFMSFCVFIIDMFLSTLTIANYVCSNVPEIKETLGEDTYNALVTIVLVLTPFASDMLTLSHPWLILIFSRGIRERFHIRLLRFPLYKCLNKQLTAASTGRSTPLPTVGSVGFLNRHSSRIANVN